MPRILPIEIGHIKYDNDEYAVYIGRSMPGQEGSLLGNPFKISKSMDRDAVIAAYRRWLWEHIQAKDEVYDELVKLHQKARSSSCLSLLCWCRRMNQSSPACHGDVLAAALQWMENQQIENS